MNEVTWTITREELLKKYKKYLPTALPEIFFITVVGLYLLWQLDDLYFGIPMLFSSYVFIFIWLVQDYHSCPHSYRITANGLYLTKGRNSETFFPWSEFYSYVDGSPMFFSNFKNNKLIELGEELPKIQRETFGVTFFLLRHNLFERLFPYFRSILVTTKPDNIEEVRSIIADNLKQISLNDIKKQTLQYVFVWGIVLLLIMTITFIFVYIKLIRAMY